MTDRGLPGGALPRNRSSNPAVFANLWFGQASECMATFSRPVNRRLAVCVTLDNVLPPVFRVRSACFRRKREKGYPAGGKRKGWPSWAAAMGSSSDAVGGWDSVSTVPIHASMWPRSLRLTVLIVSRWW